MRISDWSSDVCSSDLVIRASGIGFGTSGARGLVNDLSDEACSAFVLAFMSVTKRRFDFDRISVGWDLRPSSPRIAAAVVASVRAAGLEAECCGMLPTPALALHAITQRIPAGMVTVRPIPFSRHRCKFFHTDITETHREWKECVSKW